jgi:hypothetical protein
MRVYTEQVKSRLFSVLTNPIDEESRRSRPPEKFSQLQDAQAEQ